MATDDLTSPLGLPPKRGTKPARPRIARHLGMALAVLVPISAAAIAWMTFFAGPGDLAPASATLRAERPSLALVTPDKTEITGSIAAAPKLPTPPESAVRTTRLGTAKIIEVPLDLQAASASADRGETESAILGLGLSPEAEPELVERGSKGPLPRIAANGRRPLDAYARPADFLGSGQPQIAIVVGGLGIGKDSTRLAFAALPGAVTFAFAPYGTELPKDVAEARRLGHEILLQLPLEPFDYPRTDPGPQTLLVGAAPRENLDRLQWLMSRFGTYVGVVNHMGARFTGETGAMAPVMSDIDKRGLLYLDDGSSSRSRAKEAATNAKVPFLAADLTFDATQDAASIDRALNALEVLARSNGRAIGIATAFPLSVERLALWAKGLANRGIVLVPLTALATSVRT